MDAVSPPTRATSIHDGQGFADAMRALAPRVPNERERLLAVLMARAALAPGASPTDARSFCFGTANAARLRASARHMCGDDESPSPRPSRPSRPPRPSRPGPRRPGPSGPSSAPLATLARPLFVRLEHA